MIARKHIFLEYQRSFCKRDFEIGVHSPLNEVYPLKITSELQLWNKFMEFADRFRKYPGIYQKYLQSLTRRPEKCIQDQGRQF